MNYNYCCIHKQRTHEKTFVFSHAPPTVLLQFRVEALCKNFANEVINSRKTKSIKYRIQYFMLFISSLFSKFYSTSNGISYFAKIRCAILSHACSSDLSSVNRFIDVPVVQLSFVPSYLKFRYRHCTSAGANERCSCSRSRAIFGADIERTK